MVLNDIYICVYMFGHPCYKAILNVFPFLFTGQMTNLIFTERELVQSLKEYIQAEELKLETVRRWICCWNACFCMTAHEAVAHFCVFFFCCVSSPYAGSSWANKLDKLTRASTSDPEGFLAHPVNAYKLMKRLNTEWSELESLVLQDPSDGTLLCI